MPKASTTAPSRAWRSGRRASVTTIGIVSAHSAEAAASSPATITSGSVRASTPRAASALSTASTRPRVRNATARLARNPGSPPTIRAWGSARERAAVGGGQHLVAGLENRLVDAQHAGVVVHGQDYGADRHRLPDYSKASGSCAQGYI